MIEILKKHLTKLGFKVIKKNDNFIEMETEGNFIHNIRLSKSRLKWYLYYEIYKIFQDTDSNGEPKVIITRVFTQTEVFSTKEELNDILKDIDNTYEGRE